LIRTLHGTEKLADVLSNTNSKNSVLEHAADALFLCARSGMDARATIGPARRGVWTHRPWGIVVACCHSVLQMRSRSCSCTTNSTRYSPSCRMSRNQFKRRSFDSSFAVLRIVRMFQPLVTLDLFTYLYTLFTRYSCGCVHHSCNSCIHWRE